MRGVWLVNGRHRRWWKRGATIVVIMLLLPLAWGYVVRAETVQQVVINEFSSAAHPAWVELYNKTAEPLDITNWQVKNKTLTTQALSGTIAAGGLKVVEVGQLLNASEDEIHLVNHEGYEIDTVSYGGLSPIFAPGSMQSTARVIDGGNTWRTGQPTAGATNGIDTVAPPVPLGGQPHEVIKTTHNFAFTWPAVQDDKTAVRYEVRASRDSTQLGATPDAGNLAWYSPLLTAASLDFSSINGVEDGRWYWQVRALDEAGNRSAWSETWLVTVDTLGPAIVFQSPGVDELFGGPSKQTVTLTAIIQDNSGVQLYSLQLDGNEIASFNRNDVPKDLTMTHLLDANQLSDGQHALRVIAADSNGNVHTLAHTFVVDNTAPSLSSNITEAQKLQGTVGITLTGTDAHSSSYEIKIFKDNKLIALEDTTGITIENIKVGNGIILRWDTTKTANGVYKIQFMGTDAAGNESIEERLVAVENIRAGAGGVLLGNTSGNDPLLDQLSKQLTQPFLTAKASEVAPLAAANFTPKVDSAKIETSVGIPETDRNAKAAVMASENGWRILGVLWHWWLLVAAACMIIFYQWRRSVESMTDTFA